MYQPAKFQATPTQTKRINFWNLEKTNIFVHEYTRHSVLWNPSHPLYGIPTIKEAAYDTIGRVLGKPVMGRRMVQNRIKYLRTRYNHHVQSQAAYKPAWYGIMHEHIGPIERERRESAAQKKGTKTAAGTLPAQLADVSELSVASADLTSQQQAEAECSTVVMDETMVSTEMLASTTSSADRIEKQLKIVEKLDTAVQQSMLDLRQLAQEEIAAGLRRRQDRRRDSSSPTETNEFQLFGRNVAIQLAQMPLDMALHCQMALQGVLGTYRLGPHDRIQRREQQQQERQHLQHEQDFERQHRLSQRQQRGGQRGSRVNSRSSNRQQQSFVHQTMNDDCNNEQQHRILSTTDHHDDEDEPMVQIPDLSSNLKIEPHTNGIIENAVVVVEPRNLSVSRRSTQSVNTSDIAAFVDIVSDSDDDA